MAIPPRLFSSVHPRRWRPQSRSGHLGLYLARPRFHFGKCGKAAVHR